MNSNGGIAKAEPMGNSRSCGAAAARGQGIACPPLPYFDLDVVTVNDLQELDVCTIRET